MNDSSFKQQLGAECISVQKSSRYLGKAIQVVWLQAGCLDARGQDCQKPVLSCSQYNCQLAFIEKHERRQPMQSVHSCGQPHVGDIYRDSGKNHRYLVLAAQILLFFHIPLAVYVLWQLEKTLNYISMQ